jgi:hypothetical protein
LKVGTTEKSKDLRLLLQEWKTRVEADHEGTDSANIWEKQTVVDGRDSPRAGSTASKSSRITGFQGGLGRAGAVLGQGGVNLNAANTNYTIEDLMRRIKRI